VPTGRPAAYPAWWFEQDLIPRLPQSATKPNPSWPADYPVADDYVVAKIGQLKNAAVKASAALALNSPRGPGPAITNLVTSWNGAGGERDDFAALNQGQLKTVAGLFYKRFKQLGYTLSPAAPGSQYPWTLSTADDDGYVSVNLGQLKHVFSFTLPAYDWTGDSDHDGMNDAWETTNLVSSAASPTGNTDGDVLSNLAEYSLWSMSANPNPASSATSVTAGSVGLVVYSP